MKEIYQNQVSVYFEDCDPAGILFFGNAAKIYQRCMEDWLRAGNPEIFRLWYQSTEWGVPIRHMESFFNHPTKFGTTLTISLYLDHIGESSVRFIFTAKDVSTSNLNFELKVTHVFVDITDKSNIRKRSIPPTIKSMLEG